MSDGSLQEVHRRALALIGMNLHEAHPAVVIDGHVGELPTCAIDGVAAVAGDAVAGALDAPELLGVHVQHGPRRVVLVANDGHSL